MWPLTIRLPSKRWFFLNRLRRCDPRVHDLYKSTSFSPCMMTRRGVDVKSSARAVFDSSYITKGWLLPSLQGNHRDSRETSVSLGLIAFYP